MRAGGWVAWSVGRKAVDWAVLMVGERAATMVGLSGEH